MLAIWLLSIVECSSSARLDVTWVGVGALEAGWFTAAGCSIAGRTACCTKSLDDTVKVWALFGAILVAELAGPGPMMMCGKSMVVAWMASTGMTSPDEGTAITSFFGFFAGDASVKCTRMCLSRCHRVTKNFPQTLHISASPVWIFSCWSKYHLEAKCFSQNLHECGRSIPPGAGGVGPLCCTVVWIWSCWCCWGSLMCCWGICCSFWGFVCGSCCAGGCCEVGACILSLLSCWSWAVCCCCCDVSWCCINCCPWSVEICGWTRVWNIGWIINKEELGCSYT